MLISTTAIPSDDARQLHDNLMSDPFRTAEPSLWNWAPAKNYG